MMLDNRALNLSSLLTDVVDTLVKEGKLKEELKSRVLAVLLYRHLHVQHRTPFGFIFKKNGSREDIQVTINIVDEHKYFISPGSSAYSQTRL